MEINQDVNELVLWGALLARSCSVNLWWCDDGGGRVVIFGGLWCLGVGLVLILHLYSLLYLALWWC